MKITSFELFKVAPRWLFLKTNTDEGISGWGTYGTSPQIYPVRRLSRMAVC